MTSTTKLLKQYIEEVVNCPVDHKRLWVFDFDDTLVRTDARVYVVNAVGERRQLTPAEFASYEEHPGDTFDFSEFELLVNPKPVKWVNRILKAVYDRHGSENMTILSARGFQGPIYEHLTSISVTGLEVIALGTPSAVTPLAKASWIERRIAEKSYDSVVFLDDSERNVNAVSQLPQVAARRVIYNRVALSLLPRP